MILIISSTFDKTGGKVIEGLQQSCIEYLSAHGEDYELFEVPGAIEIPFAVQYFCKKYPEKYSVVITLGCVIKGDTDHYGGVIQSCQEGLTRLALDLEKPVIQGVLACHSEEQAIARKGLGSEYAAVALEMKSLLKQ